MKSPAYPWYPKDILTSQRVALMDLKEEGAYRRALDFCWLNGFLPADTKNLSKIIGKGCTVRTAEVVKQMFIPHPEDEKKIIHERLEIEREKQEKWIKKSSEAGRKSAEKRWGNEKTEDNQTVTNVKPSLQNGYNQTVTESENLVKESLQPKGNSSISISIPYNNINKNKEGELKNSNSWLESICKFHKLKMEEVQTNLEVFIDKLKAENDFDKSIGLVQQHFSRWLGTEHQKTEKEKSFVKKEKENPFVKPKSNFLEE